MGEMCNRRVRDERRVRDADKKVKVWIKGSEDTKKEKGR